MKFVTWIEAILVLTLVTLAVAAAGIARKVVEDARKGDAPSEAAYLKKANVDAAEQALARAKGESTRVHAKLVDAHAEVLKKDAEVAAGVGETKTALAARNTEKSLIAYLGEADARTRTAEGELSRRKKAAGGAYKDAKEVFEHDSRVDAIRAAAAAVLAVFAIAWIVVSAGRTLHIHRGFVFGLAAAVFAVAVVYEFFEEPGVIAVAALAVLALVVAIARATPQEERG